jgi:hypothetical protein
MYHYTIKSCYNADLGRSENFFTKKIPSPPLPLDGLAINV